MEEKAIGKNGRHGTHVFKIVHGFHLNAYQTILARCVLCGGFYLPKRFIVNPCENVVDGLRYTYLVLFYSLIFRVVL